MGPIAEDFLNFEDWLDLIPEEAHAVRQELAGRGVTREVVNALFHFDTEAWQAEAARRSEFLKDFPEMPAAFKAAHARFLERSLLPPA